MNIHFAHHRKSIDCGGQTLKAVIIIPTYNERENLSSLIAALQKQFERIKHEMHVLVVDDSSPDGTADVVRKLQASHTNLHLLMGRKQGLGVAYIRGMRHAMDALGAEVVYEMDADFSHKPEDVPQLMAAIDQGADFVIGSRYVTGGTIPREWGWFRRLNSRFGNLVARYVAGIYSVRDCTAGFRAIRASTLSSIDFNKLRVQG
jgi:dolichol-phosphate mannosyltransferase